MTNQDATTIERPLMNNNLYDSLKFITQIVLPALAVFYIAISPLWSLPKQEEVAGTIMAVDLLLGTLLGLSTRAYNRQQNELDLDGGGYDGVLDVTQTDEQGEPVYTLGLSSEDLRDALQKGKDEVVLKVNKK